MSVVLILDDSFHEKNDYKKYVKQLTYNKMVDNAQ